ncbi:NADP-dependent oxidoreductase [Nonomuraea sp. NPDC050536]|uniref:NADP-dependent oxidoreductase n=1 Tax=Nonomuraea sp. NPDC050536 TaxID=3364366 RepID=UPI0037C66F96
MRAVTFEAFGQPLAVTEQAVPVPGPGEVLVKVSASSVNGFDLASHAGMLQGAYEYEFPVTMGKDFAGVVAEVGPEVTEFAPGDEVFGVVARPTLGQGGFAEYVAVPAAYGIAKIPAGLDHARAGALGLAGTAALNSVDAVAPAAGEIVLVSGATGGVGSIAIQLLVARGVTVVATARAGAEAEFVTGLGATHVVDHADLEAQVRAVAPAGVDAALHLAGDGAAVAGLLVPGGRFTSTIHFVPDVPGIKATTIMSDPNQDTLGRLATEAAAGRLKVALATVYDLTEAPKAVADFTTGTLGKLGVRI